MELIIALVLSVFLFWGAKKLSVFQKRIQSANQSKAIASDSFVYSSLRDQEIDKVSHNLHRLVASLASLSFESNPYPAHIKKKIEELEAIHQSIIPYAGSDVAKQAIENAQSTLFTDSFLDLEETKVRKAIFLSYINAAGQFDFDAIKLALYNRYFYNYRTYWERQIAGFKKTSAIIHRRQYLIDAIDEFKVFLDKQNINRYHSILNDYRAFNLSELEKLQNSISITR